MSCIAEATVEYVTIDHFGALGIATQRGVALTTPASEPARHNAFCLSGSGPPCTG